jgi:hypothetical protein
MERVWKNLILYSYPVYSDLCKELMGEMVDKPTMYSKNIAGVSQYINTSLNCDSCFDLKRVEVENKGVTTKYGNKSMV